MMVLLTPPYEILEMADGEVKTLTPQTYERGEIQISPRFEGAPERKMINARRIRVPRSEKPAGAPYWDITSGTLIVTLDELVAGLALGSYSVKLTKVGVAPKARFQVNVLPST